MPSVLDYSFVHVSGQRTDQRRGMDAQSGPTLWSRQSAVIADNRRQFCRPGSQTSRPRRQPLPSFANPQPEAASQQGSVVACCPSGASWPRLGLAAAVFQHGLALFWLGAPALVRFPCERRS